MRWQLRLAVALRIAAASTVVSQIGRAAAQHVIFDQRIVDDTDSFQTSVFPADMNGDGRIDVLAANAGSNLVRLYINNGDMPTSFTQFTVTSSAQAPESVTAADINGDGEPDVLVASYTDNKVTWYRNDPESQGFDRFVIDSNAPGAASAIAADVNGDGKLDVVAAAFNGFVLYWYRNNGANPPLFTKTPISTQSIPGITDVCAIDLDRDGDLDVVAASWTGTIAWYENNGGTSPTFTQRTIATDALNAFSVSAADLDGDGDLDVLSASHADDKLAWYENDGGTPPQFTTHVISTGVDGAYDAIAADLDDDADVDIVAVDDFGAGVRWFENVGGHPPVFVEHPVIPGIEGGRHVAIADVDGDGYPDILTASTTDNTIALYAQRRVLNLPKGTSHQTIGLATATADGGDVLEAPHAAFPYEPAVDFFGKALTLESDGELVQPAGGSFTLANNARLSADGPIELGGGIELPSGANCEIAGDALQALTHSTVLLHDSALLTGTGITKLTLGGATTLENGAAIAVDGNLSLGGARPEFDPHTLSTPFRVVPDIEAGDLDGDGDLDLVVDFSSLAPDRPLNWYENNGGNPPTFTEHLVYSPLNYCETIALGDLDGDGDLDIVSGSKGDDELAWYDNSGGASPTFTKRHIAFSAPAAGYWSVQTARVNGDRKLDIVVFKDTALSWYENLGGHPTAFQEHVTGLNPFFALSTALWDADGDGNIDFLWGGSGDDKIAWAENNGASPPSFTEHVISIGLEDGPAVAAGDLDGDGDQDVLARGQYNNVIAWYENVGGSPPAFVRHVINKLAFDVTSLLVQDLDGDGDLDFVASESGQLNWYENNSATPPTFTERFLDSGAASALTAGNLSGGAGMEIIRGRNEATDITWYSVQPGGPVLLGENARLSSTGSVTSVFADHDLLDWSAATLEMSGAGKTLEVMSRDIGASRAGLDRTQPGHFPLGEFQVAAGASITLVDNLDNDGLGTAACEALYAERVVIGSGATVNNPSCRIYYGTLSLAGSVSNPENLIALPPACPGDLNGDQQVDLSDLGVVLSGFGCTDGACAGDIDGDGDTDLSDLGVVLSAYGIPCP